MAISAVRTLAFDDERSARKVFRQPHQSSHCLVVVVENEDGSGVRQSVQPVRHKEAATDRLRSNQIIIVDHLERRSYEARE